jgi:hypothetical protein
MRRLYNKNDAASGGGGCTVSDRLDREINEILRRLDRDPVRRRRRLYWRRQLAARLSQGLDGLLVRLSRVSLGQLMISSFLIICMAYFFRWVNPALMRWVIVGGLILFLTAFVFSLRRGNAPAHYDRRWRGQPIDYGSPSFTERMRAWFNRNRRGRGW